jgi:acetyl-CoA carboxylase biotin carboxyl carrier protein
MEITINSPLSGTIKQIVVHPGDAVSAGDTVAILESMKMEIPIESTAAGTVSHIAASAGGFAREGDTLVVVDTAA